jgi:hypothetical protein
LSERALPAVGIDVLQGGTARRAARVGDDQVQAAQRRGHLVNGVRQRDVVGDVGGHAMGADPERPQLGGGAGDLVGVARADADGAALVRQAQGDGPPDPARAPRDEGHLVAQAELHHAVGGGVGVAGGVGAGAFRGQRCGPGL